MGAAAAGHAATAWTGAAEMAGYEHFEGAAKAVMKLHNIDSWNAKGLVRDKLKRQMELAQKSPLRFIKIEDAAAFLKRKLNESFWSRNLHKVGIMKISKEQFVEVCWEMIRSQPDYRGNPIRYVAQDRMDLYDIFESMDFDAEGTLCRGELAGACSVLFRGTTEEVIKVVFGILDADETGTVRPTELQEYLRPIVHAMIPDNARAIQPLLLKRCTDTIFKEMDADHDSGISEQDMLQWTKAGHNMITSLSDLIDKEVYSAWMENNEQMMRKMRLKGETPAARSPPTKSQDAPASGNWFRGSGSEATGSPVSSPGSPASIYGPAPPTSDARDRVVSEVNGGMVLPPAPPTFSSGRVAPPEQTAGYGSPARSPMQSPMQSPTGHMPHGYTVPMQVPHQQTAPSTTAGMATMPIMPPGAPIPGLTPPVGLMGLVPGLQQARPHMPVQQPAARPPMQYHTAPHMVPGGYQQTRPMMAPQPQDVRLG
mmetsp:Transcript_54321/g.115952  ORF Transcript_54321/g.115952 Transcript_54321/m.115952 type:complete len:482 (+) Transcript_54321:151-1596(+)|eukprot:CAMPEP_0206465196 /NCGR_PEP_ID=MMETSP0324_2-20121206/27681_1 /ASSEMBLY_ACC=CAM_ASM_000836 /TAXON_ID=2866 /ORGANISM="Crypthecodinium cohnii, Strain Seligo" /LENGTH=481 /DNA_ID=CAMNT_0053937999 /DNA_START=106 /DNA_END=1551 /DNA_ORIENTATION=+